MALQLISIERVFVKVEATEGTDAVPTGVDAVQLLGNATIAVGAEVENFRPDLQNGLLDDAAPLPPSAKFCEISMRGQIRGLGATYTTSTVPEVHAILQGGAMLPAFAASQWTYDTASVNLKSITAYGLHGLNDGTFVHHHVLGAKLSTMGFEFQAGQAGIWTATARGIYVAPSDTADITPTYQTAAPPVFAGAGSCTLNSISPVVRMVRVTIPMNLRPRLSGNATDALAGYQQTKRSPTFEMDLEAQKVADLAAYADWVAATPRAFLASLGTVANNKFSITADKAVIAHPVTYKDDNGMWLYGLSGTLHPEGTNRVKLTFAA
jgi:tail tube protein